MQIFACPVCARPLYFHNEGCVCGASVVFDPLEQVFRPLGHACRNRQRLGCNWQAPDDGAPCLSCAMTRTIPDLRLPQNTDYWAATELAKRWVLAGLIRLGWFGRDDPGPAPIFDMIAEDTGLQQVTVSMGHDAGVIVINVSEADPARLAERQARFGELHRSMIGHMRHEIAHFLHWRLMQDPGFADSFRALFGDERADYGAAITAHYAHPMAADASHITSYATAHPHEDWAETAAHLLHHLDIVDSFDAAGLRASGDGPTGGDAYATQDTDALLRRSGSITLALNHINRSMGLQDLYPFALPPGVREKLAFAHRQVRRATNPTFSATASFQPAKL